MNLQLLSDLHLEADPTFAAAPAPGADLLVLAGDVGSYQTRRDGSAMDFVVGAEIYKHLEKVADRFDDVANEINSIVIEQV